MLLDADEHQVDEQGAQRAGDDAREDLVAERALDRICDAEERPTIALLRAAHSHSIVPGGLDVMSSTTRLTSRISLIIREAICSSRS